MKTRNRRSTRRKTRKGGMSFFGWGKKAFTKNKRDCVLYKLDEPKHKGFKGRTCDEALVKTYRFPGPARRDYSMLSDNIELFPEPSTDIYDDR